MKSLGVYIHIPFCLKKCFYCDFNSQSLKSYPQITKYIKALKNDILNLNLDFSDSSIKSIYFGGGTPSLVNPEQIADIVKLLKQLSPFKNDEIILEMNPATFLNKKISGYKKAGINRISLGVQSFKDDFLKKLGRMHTTAETIKTIKCLKQGNITNISIDLIYGIPGQTLKDWEEDLSCALNLDIQHISFYDLTLEKGTPLFKIRNSLKMKNSDQKAQMYKFAQKKLNAGGFSQYEISSFAKKGYESKHNQIYWLNQEYLGLGAGAYSYLKGLRFSRVRDICKYQNQALSGKIKYYNRERLNPEELIRETLILNLRRMSGINISDIENRFKIKIAKSLINKLEDLRKNKLLSKTRYGYCLSKKGILVYDSIAGELLD